LRSGWRISISLSRRFFIHEARKTGVGRVVYFSADAKDALVAWLEQKDPRESVLAYGKKYESITYAAARQMFVKYLKKQSCIKRGTRFIAFDIPSRASCSMRE